ncbi:MAG: polysaccharide pyruvyl transferase CsaB [Clostridia bacterium]|nr:polysaccharide pyruvyl transferase CsaB [Clostridia bacterium]
MKVLHLISGGDSGGAKTHLFSLLDKLKTRADVRVGCLMEGVFYKEILEKDIDSVLFSQKNRFDLSVVDAIADMINNEGFDVFHVHGARANFVAYFVMKKINIPTITTVHSDYLLDFDQFVKKLVFTNLNKWALKKIPYYIAVSDNFKDMLIERGFRPNAIHTVYNGMDFSHVPQNVTDKSEFAQKRNFVYDENKIYVGIAARFDAVKGVDVFIKAAGEVLEKRDNVEFLIAGDGVDREKLMRLAEETGHGDRIRFLGFERDMYGFLNLIDINCLTSLCESFPYSMLEGAAMGKCMVASRVGGIPSLVIEGETGALFESGNYTQMADKLIRLIDEPEMTRRMGENIKRRATTLFTNDNFAQTHIEIYEKILKDYHDKKRYDAVISGYYGFHNNGDDALLLSIIENIKKLKSDARIAVLSNRPDETKKLYRTDAVLRVNPFKLMSVMKRTKILISGGGSLLQDETSSKSLWYYLFIISLAKKCGARVCQFANGFGPVKREFNRKLTAKIINKNVDVITLRDKASENLMKEIGVTLPVLVTADPALLLQGADEKAIEKLFERENIPKGDFISVSVREWKRNAPDFEKNVASALAEFSRKNNLNVIFVPMQYPHDVEISKRIALMVGDGAYVIEKSASIREIIGVVTKSSMNVAMRLHSMIYSVGEGVKTVALRYDPKIDGFMEYVGLDGVCDVENITHEGLIEALEMALTSVSLTDCESLREKARFNFEKAIELIDNQ